MSSLREAAKRLDAMIDDLSSLHVQTYTGRVSVDLDNLPDGTHGAERIRAAVEAARASGEVELVAESYYQFDGDSYNFIVRPGAEIPPNAIQMHEAAVESGIRTRMALLEFVKDVFT